MHNDNEHTEKEIQLTQEEQVAAYYRWIQQSIHSKFQSYNKGSLQQTKNKIKRHINRNQQAENIHLIEAERTRIHSEMMDHIAKCLRCKEIRQITLKYNLFKGHDKEDVLSMIARKGIAGLGDELTECRDGKIINEKMMETHRMMRNL